jgi:hypothetical protein
MKKYIPLFAMVLICLASFALFAAQGALQRGQRMLFIVLMVIALIFWKRSLKSP